VKLLVVRPSLQIAQVKGGASGLPERVAAMSDSQLTSIARLSERLNALKERL
jgi:hypothetical protein